MSASGSNLALPWYGLMIFTVVFVTSRLPSLFTVVRICLGLPGLLLGLVGLVLAEVKRRRAGLEADDRTIQALWIQRAVIGSPVAGFFASISAITIFYPRDGDDSSIECGRVKTPDDRSALNYAPSNFAESKTAADGGEVPPPPLPEPPPPPPHPKRSRQAKTAAALRLFISQTRK